MNRRSTSVVLLGAAALAAGVVAAALTRVGQAGDIVTVDEFDDFELTLEWKLSPNGNSGVFYRVTEDDDKIRDLRN
ncbi:MAG TPA: family 16 glycoside hydrolase [Vicinamibacterales bacterium]|jgi:hypothetical protein|nr:family 16 glycoside hydrolase [Vicinamibacterales bacterium]